MRTFIYILIFLGPWLGCTQDSEKKTVKEQKLVFYEDFEARTIEDVAQQWNERKNLKGMSFSNDVPQGSRGKQSLKITYIAGKDEGGHLFKNFPEGYDQLYARFYVKFLTRKAKLHHLVKLGGYYPRVPYPQGKAGLKPSGADFFISGIETPDYNKWNWGFYTYWMHMAGSPNKYWGNVFFPKKAKKVPVGEWICVEFMIKVNNPVNSYNGEQAFWINGKKILHLGEGFPNMDRNGGWNLENADGIPFEGFQWRSDDRLKLSFFWLNYYMTKGAPGEIDQILFDDVVISKEYIGPLKNSKKE